MYTEKSVPDQTGKTVLVTGANTGIGYETARVLANRGARVMLGCRDHDKAQSAIDSILETQPNANLEWVPLDLSSLNSVQAAADLVNQEYKLDILINNAGVMIPPKTKTEDGFELQFGVNHLGHFALTGLLLRKLLTTENSRIVNVSSLAHKTGEIDFDDIHADQSYDPMKRYQMSKVANVLFTLALTKKLEAAGSSTKAVACHPGIAATELGRYFPWWFVGVGLLIRPFFNSSAEGALPTLEAATKTDVNNFDYFGPTRRGEMARGSGPGEISDRGRDEGAAEKLWEISESLTGVNYAFA